MPVERPKGKGGRVECLKGKMDGEWFHHLCSHRILAKLTFSFFKGMFSNVSIICVQDSLPGFTVSRLGCSPPFQGNKSK